MTHPDTPPLSTADYVDVINSNLAELGLPYLGSEEMMVPAPPPPPLWLLTTRNAFRPWMIWMLSVSMYTVVQVKKCEVY